MLKYTDYDIVFQEIPDETTLAINISNCPIHCPDCHSKELWEDIGEELTIFKLMKIVEMYEGITCICFMGGDNNIDDIIDLIFRYRKINNKPKWMQMINFAWYSGQTKLPQFDNDNQINDAILSLFNYIKLGPYIKEKGPLNNPNTNQRLYEYSPIFSEYTIGKGWRDITCEFWK